MRINTGRQKFEVSTSFQFKINCRHWQDRQRTCAKHCRPDTCVLHNVICSSNRGLIACHKKGMRPG